jgi:adenylate cyclase class 2
MASSKEVEIKFSIHDMRQLERKLKQAGFRQVTASTHEMNTLYDLPGHPLRAQGALLRLRKYGSKWVLTHKAKGKAGRHKSRTETETAVDDGKKMDVILQCLGFRPSFRYEKYRAEWTDGNGHVVLDETPVGDFGEIEGPAQWIDKTAKVLGIAHADYNTKSYAEVFFDWKRRTKSTAAEMTFDAVEKSLRRKPR